MVSQETATYVVLSGIGLLIVAWLMMPSETTSTGISCVDYGWETTCAEATITEPNDTRGYVALLGIFIAIGGGLFLVFPDNDEEA